VDHQADLIDLSAQFLDEIKNKTPGKDLELWLNTAHGPASTLYQGLSRVITAGVRDGCAATVEITGPDYRRSRILAPTAQTSHFSVTAIYTNSVAPTRGAYHPHPYGEISLVVPLNPGALLAGPLGWRGAGWTAHALGSSHYPQVSGGAVIALSYLPAGRISYDIEPPRPVGRDSESGTDGEAATAPAADRPWQFGLDSVPPSRDHEVSSFARSTPR
jgi:hypothetical protein